MPMASVFSDNEPPIATLRTLIASRSVTWSGTFVPCAPLRAVATDVHGDQIWPYNDDVCDAILLLLRDAR